MGHYRALVVALLLALLVAVPGCRKKEPQNNKESGPSIEQLEAEAKEMDNEQLRTHAEKYKTELAVGRAEVEQLLKKLQNLTQQEKAAGEAERINTRLGELQKSMQVSRERMAIYYRKLVEKGVDVTDLRYF